MLKFQGNHTTTIETFEEFILAVFVMIDDLYKQFAPPNISARQHVLDAKPSDPEIITISICGVLAGVDSENAWYSFIRKITAPCSRVFVEGAVLTGQEELFSRWQNSFAKDCFLHFLYPSDSIS